MRLGSLKTLCTVFSRLELKKPCPCLLVVTVLANEIEHFNLISFISINFFLGCTEIEVFLCFGMYMKFDEPIHLYVCTSVTPSQYVMLDQCMTVVSELITRSLVGTSTPALLPFIWEIMYSDVNSNLHQH